MDYYYDYDAEGMDDEYLYADDYNDGHSLGHGQTNLQHVFQNCIQPSLQQTSSYILHMLCWCLLCRCLSMMVGRRRQWLQHTISFVCGLAVLYNSMANDCLVVVFLAICSYTFLLILDYFGNVPKGRPTAAVTIVFHFAYEFIWNKPDEWQRIRGLQMIAAMKIISLAFDLDGLDNDMGTTADKRKSSSITKIPGLMAYMGYIFCPFTCILGPWIPYRLYQRGAIEQSLGNLLKSCLWCAFNVLVACVFLSMSNCLVPTMFVENSWLGFRTYRDALSIRCSHYFICFLSQATFAIGGQQTLNENAAMYPVTQPWQIELPRSLSSVVRYWNIPMHDWLKLYVYGPLQKRCQNYPVAAVLGTYFVSCLLHGIHLRVYLVLLSLGCFALVELVVRKKLASIFDACITANPCRKPCTFRYCTNKPEVTRTAKTVVRMVNFCFSQMAVLHLAYLGVMMNEESDGNTEEMSVLQKWSNLNYLSHWMTLVTYGIYTLV